MIFTVTAIRQEERIRDMRVRCFGYFTDENRALIAVQDNECDMHECLYTFLVIERVPQGIHPVIRDGFVGLYWFEWQGDWHDGKWVKLHGCPEQFKDTVGWSIG